MLKDRKLHILSPLMYHLLERILEQLKPLFLAEDDALRNQLVRKGFHPALCAHPSILYGHKAKEAQAHILCLSGKVAFLRKAIYLRLLKSDKGHALLQQLGIPAYFGNGLEFWFEEYHTPYIPYSIPENNTAPKHIAVYTALTGNYDDVNEILYKTLAATKNHAKIRPGKCAGIEGLEYIDKVICLDQSPIGRTPRSNPATYTGVFSDIRELFASTQDARVRGYTGSRFSFNIKGGRCETCGGDGLLKIEMHFLPDVYVPCEVCGGKRYNRETLEVKYKGKNISDVLDMTVEEACTFFANQNRILSKIQTLYDVGLGYVKLGQSSTTLSGGEAQRVKLATELSRRSTGSTLYVLDEPTTGLHASDVHRLLNILDRLVDAGNTVVVIEHNLDVIKTADTIIDLGPEGGDQGGELIFTGTPEECAACEKSYTGQYLKKLLGSGRESS